ncbi:MAG: formylglycine-generating enzyme family protein [Bryobacterales bacterium]|nr:formylglycine-generating enzyme family protein [Bryobacterales bacterium]
MGCSYVDTECEPDERPRNTVTLSTGNWMSQTEITVAAYRKFAQATKRSMPPAPSCPQGDDHSIVNVDWNDAQQYCQWAGGRLPTEAEWEYAARAGSRMARYGDLENIAWHSGNSGGATHPVAKKTANASGLYDILGNVWEWCFDWHSSEYRGVGERDPEGPPDGSERLSRGGGWLYYLRSSRASNRNGYLPAYRDNSLGFRCVREVIP